MPPWHVQENKWRAARYGLDADIILDAASNERLVTDDLADLLERLDPGRATGWAARRSCRSVADIPRARGVVPAAAGGRRSETGGDLVAVVDSVVARAARVTRLTARLSPRPRVGHLQAYAEQPHRPVALDPVEQRRPPRRPARPGRWSARAGCRLRVTVKNGR